MYALWRRGRARGGWGLRRAETGRGIFGAAAATPSGRKAVAAAAGSAAAPPTLETPILIVGGGLSGSALSALLARYRVPHLVVDAAPDPGALLRKMPRRDSLVLPRAMEMLRHLGHRDLSVIARSPPLREWRVTAIGRAVVDAPGGKSNMLGFRDEFAALRTAPRGDAMCAAGAKGAAAGAAGLAAGGTQAVGAGGGAFSLLEGEGAAREDFECGLESNGVRRTVAVGAAGGGGGGIAVSSGAASAAGDSPDAGAPSAKASVRDWYTDPHSPTTAARVPAAVLTAAFLDSIDRAVDVAGLLAEEREPGRQGGGAEDDGLGRADSAAAGAAGDGDAGFAAAAAAAGDAFCHRLYGYEWVGGFSGALGVTSSLRRVSDGAEVVCNSGFVVGADGRNSLVRTVFFESEGARMEDVSGYHPRHFLTVEFTSPQLARAITQGPGDAAEGAAAAADAGAAAPATPPGLWRQIVVNRKILGFVDAQNLSTGAFALHALCFGDHQNLAKLARCEKSIRKMITAAAGTPLSDCRIDATFPTGGVGQLLSRNVDASTGRVALVSRAWRADVGFENGAAAGGLADAQNLAWKLAFIFHHNKNEYAHPELLTGSPVSAQTARILESYMAERLHAAHFEVKSLSERLETFLKWFDVGNVQLRRLDTFSDGIKALHTSLRHATNWPCNFARKALDKLHTAYFRTQLLKVGAKQAFFPLWLSSQYWTMEMLRQRIDCLPNPVPWGLDLCVAYRNSPLNPQVPNAIPYVRAPRDPNRYNPACIAGCRIPHVFVFSDHPAGKQIFSTVDIPLLDPTGLKFALLVWDWISLDIILAEVERQYLPANTEDTALTPAVDALSNEATHINIETGSSFETELHQLRLALRKVFGVVWQPADDSSAWTFEKSSLGDLSVHLIESLPQTLLTAQRTNASGQLEAPDSAGTSLATITRAGSLAGHIGVEAALADFKNVNSLPWSSPQESRALIGRAITGRCCAQSLDSRNSDLTTDVRSIWSDGLTLESFKHALRLSSPLRQCALILRPDSHVATMCPSVKDPQALSAFVTEILKLPLF